MNQLLDEGRSLSGNERNVCLLNLGAEGRYADVSAVSGFDFPFDARSVAPVDWDHDGDLDVWVTNRTAPRLQMLRNESGDGHHFLAVRLEGNGTTCNRDAIGARVELTPHNPQRGLPVEEGSVPESDSRHPRSVKTLRAGDGYLSQSGKWLHFGLGTARGVQRLTVHWPDGDHDQFVDLEADRHYVIVQGEAAPKPWNPPRRSRPVVAARTEKAEISSRARVVLAERLPLPAMQYVTSDGARSSLREHGGKPMLVNLWASWCAPCIKELVEFAHAEDELRGAGLRILALSLDSVSDSSPRAQEAPRKALEQISFPFDTGRATAEFVDILHLVHRHLFHRPRELPVPVSLLIDSEGRLAVIYRGPVAVELLMRDVANLRHPPPSSPIAGRWISPPEPTRLAPIAWKLLDKGDTEQGIEFVESNAARLKQEPDFADLATKIGTERLKRGEWAAATERFEDVLKIAPDHDVALNNLAWIMSTAEDARLRNGLRAVELAEEALRLATKHRANALETLAAAYAEAGRFDEALQTAKEALAAARKTGNKSFANEVLRQLSFYQSGQAYRVTVSRRSK